MSGYLTNCQKSKDSFGKGSILTHITMALKRQNNLKFSQKNFEARLILLWKNATKQHNLLLMLKMYTNLMYDYKFLIADCAIVLPLPHLWYSIIFKTTLPGR